MNERSFLDSNILVYTDDQDAPEKREVARGLLERAATSGKGVVSTQVLCEYFSAATRKLGVPAEVARSKVELFSRLATVVLQPEDVLAAIDLHRLHHLSIWDGLILRAAKHAACRVVYSEDLQSGQVFDGVRIVNPFASGLARG